MRKAAALTVAALALTAAAAACSSSSSSPPPAAVVAAPPAAAAAAAPAPSARAGWAEAIRDGKALAGSQASNATSWMCDIGSGDGDDKLDKKAAAALKEVAATTAALEKVAAKKDATDAEWAPLAKKQADAMAKAKRACQVAGDMAAKRRGADEGDEG